MRKVIGWIGGEKSPGDLESKGATNWNRFRKSDGCVSIQWSVNRPVKSMGCNFLRRISQVSETSCTKVKLARASTTLKSRRRLGRMSAQSCCFKFTLGLMTWWRGNDKKSRDIEKLWCADNLVQLFSAKITSLCFYQLAFLRLNAKNSKRTNRIVSITLQKPKWRTKLETEKLVRADWFMLNFACEKRPFVVG